MGRSSSSEKAGPGPERDRANKPGSGGSVQRIDSIQLADGSPSMSGGARPTNRVRRPVRIVPKGWGREVWIANGPLYCGKILEIEQGKRCSLHYHRLKTESFYLRSGRLKVRVKEHPGSAVVEEFELMAGECMDVTPGLVHQMEALEHAELYEFSTQHFDSDSHRLIRGD
jgi:mannose-6-phosphate isomerase-like protein (cupin superfamily)